MSNSLRLAETLAARLCHDLSGPLGTLAASREIAQEGGEAAEEARLVADEAAGELSRRLRLLRAAWGGRPTEIGPDELANLAEGLPNRRRVAVDMAGLDQRASFSGPAGRLVLNMLLLGVEALPAGGKLVLSGSAMRQIVLTISGPRAAWPAGFAACLVDAEPAWSAIDDARRLQGPLTALIAHDSGLRLTLPSAADEAGSPAPLVLWLTG